MKKFLLGMLAGIALCFVVKQASANEGTMPVSVTIVQCGSKEQLLDSCHNVDPRCCNLIAPAAGDEQDTEQQSSYTYEILDYGWTERPIDAERKIMNLE